MNEIDELIDNLILAEDTWEGEAAHFAQFYAARTALRDAYAALLARAEAAEARTKVLYAAIRHLLVLIGEHGNASMYAEADRYIAAHT